MLALLPLGCGELGGEDPDFPTVELMRVIDAESIRVRYKDKYETVRLLGIDGPREPEGPEQQIAVVALMKMLSASHSVRLEWEQPGREARDRRGRLLAYVFAGETLINVEMVRRGHARYRSRHGKGRYADRFRTAQKKQ